MYYFGRCRITTAIYYIFISVFLGSFVIFTTLSTLESPPKKSEVAANSHLIQKIWKGVPPKNKVAEASGTSCQPLHYIPHAETRPVTALASFPGSGNTWLRYLIQQSTGVHTGSQYVDKVLLRRGFPGEPVFDGSVAVVKTHEWGPKIRERFQKAVLLIRSPKPAILSLYNLWRGGGHVGLAPQKMYEMDHGEDWRKFFNGYIRDWQSTNLDWVHNFTGPLHIVLYDQLRNDLGPTLRSLVQFLDLPLNETAIQCTIEHSEGLYHRRPRSDNFDPYTDDMKKRIAEVEDYVYKELEEYLKTQPASSNVPLFKFLKRFNSTAHNGEGSL